ncbi:hypothetical protein B7P43_G17472 [Cryptotermes secundus]|uniref:Uncharacterized protein n=3 Tax=Cryptotermes secundus TaxID=105785 RepID=A0A2J7R495_9NEOP|nr:hypothetical protein B7P43_G17472 [Cryptotermes secundus]
MLEQINRSNESVLGSNVHSHRHSTRPTIDSSVVNGEISLNDSSTQHGKGTTMQSVEESSAGSLIQTERRITISLDENYVQPRKADAVSSENTNVQSEREDLHLNQNISGNDTQILTEVTSSLQQYSYNMTGNSTFQPLYNTLINTIVEPIMKNISSENITTNLNTQYLHNISRSDVQRSGNNLSSVRTTAYNLSSQSLEITTLFAKSHDSVTFSPYLLSTSNHENESLHTPAMNNSNINDFNHPPIMPINPLVSYSMPSTNNLSTAFPEVNTNLSEDHKQVGQEDNNITYTVHSNVSDQYSALHTRKLPEGKPVVTLIPEEVHKVPSVTQNSSSFISSRVSERNIQTNTFENYTSFHSESSINPTTPLFYSSAGAYINSEISPNTFPVTTTSTESEIASETIIESHNVVSEEDFPQTILAPVTSANCSAMSLVTPVSHSLSSSFDTPTKTVETWDTNATPTVSSVGNILSSAIFNTVESRDVTTNKISSNAKAVESVISNFISNTAPSLENITSRTIFNTVPSVNDVTSNTISSNVESAENMSSEEVSSTVQSVETLTSSTVSYIMPSVENAISDTLSNLVAVVNVTSTAKPSNSISSTIQSLETVTSNTVPNTVQSTDNVTSGAISHSVLSAETSNTISQNMQSAKTVTLNSFPSTVLSLTVVTSNTTSSPLLSLESVTSSTSSTFASTVPSIKYILPTKDAKQGDKFQVDIVSGKDESSHRTEDEIGKSFDNLSDNSNTTSLNVIHEQLFVKSEKLTETEKKEDPLTIVFKSDMEVAEWFLSWDMVFRKYTSKALTGCMEVQEKWNKTLSPEDICYMIPGPYADGGNFTICILVKGHAMAGSMFISGKYLQKCLEEMILNLKQMLHIEIIDIFIGIPTAQQSHCRIQEMSWNRIKVTVAVIVVIAISMSIIAALIFTIKHRQRQEFLQPTAGLSYQLRSHNDGRHLATDEECTAMEASNVQLQEVKEEKANGSTPSTSKAPAVVKFISKEEHEKWVVPYDEVIIQGEKSIGHEDTRL